MFGKKKKDEIHTGNKEKTPAEMTATTVDGAKEETEVTVPPITWREIKYLKKANYEQTKNKFKKAFVIMNIRTGQIVELNAASAYHACNIIGWKARKVRVLEEKDLTEVPEVEVPEVEALTEVPDEQEEAKV